MDDACSGDPWNTPARDEAPEPRHARPADEVSAWERALQGPPINPRSSLIYHDPR